MASRMTSRIVRGRRLVPLFSPSMGGNFTDRSIPPLQHISRAWDVQRNGWEPHRLASTAATSSETTASKEKETKEDSGSNIFLDNLGKIFLGAIGAIILAIVRSSKGRTNKIRIRDNLEEYSALDPLEIDDLRVANSHLTPELFDTIVQDVKQAFPLGTATHDDFVRIVRTTLKREGGDACTIELGHLLDRVILSAMQERKEEEMPITFFLTALSLALYSDVPERMVTLYKMMEQTTDTDTQQVKLKEVVEVVGYLQDTCQLIPDAQIVEIPAQKYPIQQYRKGDGSDLVQWEGSSDDVVDMESFASILCTRSVCAWGECHNRKLKVAK